MIIIINKFVDSLGSKLLFILLSLYLLVAVSKSNILFVGVVEIIAKDKIIRIFGQLQILRKGPELDFTEINQIRAKLRFLARLKNLISEKSGEYGELANFLKPKHYDTFVQAVLEIREQNKQLALTLGHYIKQIANIHIA